MMYFVCSEKSAGFETKISLFMLTVPMSGIKRRFNKDVSYV